MEKFENFEGIAAALPMINVDTDMIIPKQFLKTIKRTGLGKNLFYDMRCTPEGEQKTDFVLNQPPWTEAKILVAGLNFGCGSSREHAVWAIRDFGIRCVIAPSFADIFYGNCFKNGILPIRLDEETVNVLMQAAEEGEKGALKIDLDGQTITRADGSTLAFTIDPFLKHCLLEGLDDIALTLQKEAKISAFEAKQRDAQPWLYR
ncbi:MAG: 3-isopropylmalate dehydratase small subunit [Alphaproteobacteria bacterium]|nr:3-isopropylmalate dehydratase small subunit [Alphaproteobacteria bacterium]